VQLNCLLSSRQLVGTVLSITSVIPTHRSRIRRKRRPVSRITKNTRSGVLRITAGFRSWHVRECSVILRGTTNWILLSTFSLLKYFIFSFVSSVEQVGEQVSGAYQFCHIDCCSLSFLTAGDYRQNTDRCVFPNLTRQDRNHEKYK
jgi:hypothetical protein